MWEKSHPISSQSAFGHVDAAPVRGGEQMMMGRAPGPSQHCGRPSAVMPMAGLCPSPYSLSILVALGAQAPAGALPGRGRGPAEGPGGPKKPLLIIHPKK